MPQQRPRRAANTHRRVDDPELLAVRGEDEAVELDPLSLSDLLSGVLLVYDWQVRHIQLCTRENGQVST